MPTLEWIGKDKVINHHQDVPYRVLERIYCYDENGQHDEDNGSENAEAPLTVVNTRGFDLPETGDNGTLMFTVFGILIMAGAAGILYIATRKKNA